MTATRTIGNVSLTCDDGLPYGQIQVKGENFTLSWHEKKEGGEWTRQVRHLGWQGRALVGKGILDPELLKALEFDPLEYAYVWDTPPPDAPMTTHVIHKAIKSAWKARP